MRAVAATGTFNRKTVRTSHLTGPNPCFLTVSPRVSPYGHFSQVCPRNDEVPYDLTVETPGVAVVAVKSAVLRGGGQ